MSDVPTPEQVQWQEEEVSQSRLTFDIQFDKQGNPVSATPTMVEEKLKRRYTDVPLLPHQICTPGDHYFQFRNGGKRVAGRVEVQCRGCSYGRDFVVGVHEIVDGKIIEKLTEPKG